jgi:hypothetical protein
MPVSNGINDLVQSQSFIFQKTHEINISFFQQAYFHLVMYFDAVHSLEFVFLGHPSHE